MRISARVWLVLVLLAAFAARMFRLGVDSLWYDETVSVFLARQDLVALTRHTAGDIHPPLYYYLLHFWGAVVGWSEFSAAFLSLIFGILLVALVYRVGRDWLGGNVALIAAFLVAISPYNLWYSQEVRMYTLGAALGLASVYFLIRMLRGPAHETSRNFVLYAIVSALGMYTLYYFAFLLVFEALAALVWLARSKSQIPKLKSQIWTWVGSQAAIVALYASWIPVAFRQAIDPPVPPWRSFTPFGDVLVQSFSALALGQSVDPAAVVPVLIVAAIVLVAGLGSRYGMLLLGYTLVPLLLIYGLSIWKPLYHVRYAFIYSPAFYLLLALGITRVADLAAPYMARAKQVALVLLTLACAYSAYNFWFDPQYREDDLRGAVQRLANEWHPGDAILLDAGYTYTAFDYYYNMPVAWRGRLTDYVPSTGDAERGAVVLQTGSIGGDPDLGWGNADSDFYATTAAATRASLDRVFATHPRVWLLRLYDTVVDPDGLIRDYMAQNGRIFDDQGFAGESYARVQGYLTPNAAVTALPQAAAGREITLGNRVVFKGFEPPSIIVRAGETAEMNLYWAAKEPTNIDAHLFVGLYNGGGQLIASKDEIPLGNGLGTSRWTPGEILREPVRLVVPANATAGTYTVRIALYNPLTNEPLETSRNERVQEGSQIEITALSVQ